jgi:hypothetical protein
MGCGVKLATVVYLAPSVRMSGVIIPRRHMLSWHEQGNFTYWVQLSSRLIPRRDKSNDLIGHRQPGILFT